MNFIPLVGFLFQATLPEHQVSLLLHRFLHTFHLHFMCLPEVSLLYFLVCQYQIIVVVGERVAEGPWEPGFDCTPKP